MKRLTLEKMAYKIGYAKYGRKWCSSFYLHLWNSGWRGDGDFGDDIYLSDGVYIEPDFMTSSQIKEEYADWVARGCPDDPDDDDEMDRRLLKVKPTVDST